MPRAGQNEHWPRNHGFGEMGSSLHDGDTHGLERSCKSSPGDWMRHAPAQPGVERIEAFFCAHAYDPHRHDRYAIGYTLNGVQSFDYRGARADSAAGHAMVIHPDELHNGRASGTAGFRYRMLYLQPHVIRAALGSPRLALPFVRDVVTPRPELLQALLPALGDLSRPLEPLELDGAIGRIAAALLALDPSAGQRRKAPSCAIAVERARQYLDAHAERCIGSTELESLTGLDRYALARHFQAQLGTSPYRYLTMRRLERARSAIGCGSSLSEAAQLAGFADQSHMTRQFKRAYGLAPGRWRRMRISA